MCHVPCEELGMQTQVRCTHSCALEMPGFQRKRTQALEVGRSEIPVLYQQLAPWAVTDPL